MKKILAACGAALMLLAGCGTSQPAETVTATTTVTATPTGHVEFVPDSLRDLRIGIGQAGLVCANWDEISENAGQCDGGTLLSWFPNTPEGLALHKAAINLSLSAIISQGRTDVDMLVGPNWFARVSSDAAPILQNRIGGVILGAA